jgi:RND family efflux transporter MFP subunit
MSRKRILWSALAVCLVVAAVSVVFLHHAGAKPAPAAPHAASVVEVARGTLASSLTVAGQFQPYQEVDLHAKVSGYIRRISVDIGDRVKQGQVLAVLEVPELRDQVQGADAVVRRSQSEIGRSQSEVVRARSDYSSVHAAYERLAEASKQKPGLVAEQELDDARAKDQAAQAQIDVAKAALESTQQQLGVSRADQSRLESLSSYTSIVAPFSGVVTMRYADTGSLIQSGTASNTQSMPVVRVAQSDVLRLRMPVPETDVPYIRIGEPVQIRVNATGRTLSGTIIRFTRALDPGTRTMLAEVDVPNSDLSLNPGMFAETTLQLQQKSETLILPSQAVVHDGAQDYVLALDENNHVVRRNVSVGIQTANSSEILTGVRVGERVIASGQTNYQTGEVVTPRPAFIPTQSQEVSQ